jgi:DNA repair photolyase
MLEEKYSNCMQLTSQFPMCGNPFRVDTYKGCSFGCKYCFANARKAGGYTIKHQVSDIRSMKRKFYDAIVKGETNNINKELLNRYTPIHLGGMSDPFQKAEMQ